MQRILIVDDIEENRYFLEVLLKGNGFDVSTATNGAEALEAARNNPPDLVVSDILMPVMDGYTLCRECKNDSRLRGIPFVFYTATYTEQRDQDLAMGLGAARFVIKPREPEELVAIIKETLNASLAGNAKPAGNAPREEGVLLREYNEVLFGKLEKKMAELERTNSELERTMVEQKRTEEQLRQAQKMEAIGRFSAGIAHDFNNILTVIVGYAFLIQRELSHNAQLREMMDYILSATEQGKNLTRSLLTFSRKQEVNLAPLDLNEKIRSVERFLTRIIGADITLKLSLTDDRYAILADHGHIEQLLMNLAANARDAMPNGGIFSIGADLIDIDESFLKFHGFGAPGRYVVITAADSGVGMDEATRQRIFEPFYTTKDSTRGTGLGLSIIYGIVKQHRGYITVYSEQGQGATFRIYLPLMEGGWSARDTTSGQRRIPRGSETILVVDDEESVRKYLELFLTELGYGVLLARDGREAIDLFRRYRHEVGLVLMDVVLPLVNGRDAAREIRNIREGVRIVFSSGYPYDLVYGRNLLERGERLLMKPLTPSELAETLRDALDGGDKE